MENLTIKIDFTGHSAPQGLTILDEGLYVGTIDGFNHYEDSNRLYVYINAMADGEDAGRVRESFNLSGKGLDFLLAFLQSAGANMAKLKGQSNVPFHSLVGKNVYFKYTPPTTDAAGEAVQGSYANFRFYTEKQFSKMVPSAPAPKAAENFQVEEPSTVDNVQPQTVAADSDGDDWLTN